MRANEIRIGNFLQDEFGKIRYGYVTQINDSSVRLKMEFSRLLCSYKDVNPIPLTEECVFELEDKYWDFIGFGTRLIYQDKLNPAIKIEKSKTQWAFYFNDELINFKDYLHEAQNLYFALTGEELTLNKIP